MQDILTDTEKFSIIARVYHNKYIGYTEFANMIQVGRSTVHNWEKRATQTINGKSKTKICEIFNLQYTIWTDKFDDEINFESSLDDYQKITNISNNNKEETITKKMVGETKPVTKYESTLLETLDQNDVIDIDSITLEEATPIFLFELVQLLKNKKKIKEALRILEFIEAAPGTYKYANYNKIQHLKAILLSDDKLKNWDQAIHILSLLYSASQYHLHEPEIITLMASNLKRKALTDSNGWINKNSIDKDLLFRSFSLYHDAYQIKDAQNKYYDAINIAYLNNIIDSVEPDFSDKLGIKDLYNELSHQWIPDESNWWETSSKAEFLMLIDQPDIAISEISLFLETQEIQPFEIESTIRQIEMYLNFVDDESAKVFYQYVKESWELLHIVS